MAERRVQDNHENDIELGPLGKEDGKITASVKGGNMVAVLSGMEVMYVFLYRGQYQCFIHPLDGEEGRHKAFPVDERNTAMLANLNAAADHLFEIRFQPHMDYMGVMVAAETGIIRLLDSLGTLPAEDVDFMAAPEDKEESQ